ncbi:short chain oxidoreductase [Xylogone sp. PMI_703]|nr:short chain oxidoreductase [Xylogone sp. PMI_703]
MATYLITGASRGLGLKVAEILAAKPSSEVSLVVATARNTSPGLQSLAQKSFGRVVIVHLEVTDEKSLKEAADKVENIVRNKGLDVLVNNAGVTNYNPDGIETMNDLMSIFSINVNSAHLIIRAFLPLLRKGKSKEIVLISSSMGSITRAPDFMFQPTPAYKISKAALNMLMVQYSLDLADEGFIVFSMCPGWVQTDMGSSAADLTIEQGGAGIVDRITRATKEDNGKFVNTCIPSWKYNGGPNRYDGTTIPF